MVEAEDDDLETLVAGAVTTLTLLVAFGLMFAGVPYFWVAFPVGFGGLLPTALAVVRLYKRRPHSRSASEQDDALATLRDRYARGDLADAEFERQVERLIETEDAEVAGEPPTGVEPNPARERERE